VSLLIESFPRLAIFDEDSPLQHLLDWRFGSSNAIIGPDDSIMVEHARDHGAFIIVDKNDPGTIEIALAKTRDSIECAKLYSGRQRAFDRLCSREIMNSRWKISEDWLFE
jgi:hypothetical protein